MVRTTLGMLVLLAIPTCLQGQDTLPPSQGGRIRSLGLPAVRKPYFGLSLGLNNFRQGDLTAHARLGTYRDITLPTTGLLGVAAEGYLGAEGGASGLDGGARALLVSNLLRIGTGLDYNVHHSRLGFLLTVDFPMRRGGVLGRGSKLRLDVVAARDIAGQLTVQFPIRQPNSGTTRPARDFVSLDAGRFTPLPFRVDDPALDSATAELRERALWVGRLTTPSLGRLSGDAERAVDDVTRSLRERLDGRTVEDEIREYHAVLQRTFALAAGDSLAGAVTTCWARGFLLYDVLFPYNRLLGQKKESDTIGEYAAHARGVFVRWLVTESNLPIERHPAVIDAFQRVLEIVEAVRADGRQRWGDSRFGWLPLQLALRPEDYDEQTELDSLISQAVGQRIMHGNRVRYVHNQRFQQELRTSIALARDYHVLWIHDFAGLNEHGEPDRLSLYTVAQAYLAALRDAALRYDSTGQVPAFMLFIDQHYFEKNRSRQLLAFLSDPLGRSLDLPAPFDSLAGVVLAAQRDLSAAVDASRLLTAERAQYGESWLRALMKVHVSVTNPADPSFRSRWVLPLIGLPDDAMRDHRKLVVWDVTEADPYRGWAMYAGAGVGEHYVGPSWEDRAVVLQGPAALSVRQDIRALLESQGISGNEVPHVLREQPLPRHYAERIRQYIDSMDQWGGVATRAVQLHNGTGYAWKNIDIAKATLFSLTSPGAVIKVPDSLWLSEFLASLLAGAALRGTRVVLIAPSRASAPSAGAPQLAVLHAVLSRVLAMRYALSQPIEQAGGAYRLALYDSDTPVDDIGARIAILRGHLADTPFLRELYGLHPSTIAVLAHPPVCNADSMPEPPPVTPANVVRPKLHFKGFLYVSQEPWKRLIGGAPLAVGLTAYLEQRASQICGGGIVDEEQMAEAMMLAGAQAINPVLDSVPPEMRDHWAFYLMVGSANEDNRSLLMDGEAAVLVSRWTSLLAMPDFLLLAGISTWIDEQAELDRLLPPPGGPKRWLGRMIRYGL